MNKYNKTLHPTPKGLSLSTLGLQLKFGQNNIAPATFQRNIHLMYHQNIRKFTVFSGGFQCTIFELSWLDIFVNKKFQKPLPEIILEKCMTLSVYFINTSRVICALTSRTMDIFQTKLNRLKSASIGVITILIVDWEYLYIYLGTDVKYQVVASLSQRLFNMRVASAQNTESLEEKSITNLGFSYSLFWRGK
jgi:hypothetical protein